LKRKELKDGRDSEETMRGGYFLNQRITIGEKKYIFFCISFTSSSVFSYHLPFYNDDSEMNNSSLDKSVISFVSSLPSATSFWSAA
jgi:hypothetical protein